MPVSQTITAIPAAGRRGVDIQDVFVGKQEAFQDALTGVTVGQLNTAFGQLNGLETNVNNKEASAEAHAGTATTQAGIATAQADIATAQAGLAETARIATQAIQTATEAVYDAFDDRELGSKTSAPTLDNDGNALQEGAQYWNSTSKKKFIWNGSIWVDLTINPSDHGSLTGLADDDHAQYHNDTRGDARYLKLNGGSLTGALNEARATVASHATTADIWGALGNQIDFTGTATITAFPTAPQAGATRELICAGACSFTAGANMIIDGVPSGTVTCASGDTVIVRAITTTQFKLSITKYSGMQEKLVSGTNIKTVNGISVLGSGDLSITSVLSVEYTDRASLRALTPANGNKALIKELGLFEYVLGSTELDDDETSFATSLGRWLLQCPSYDFIEAQLGYYERIFTATGDNTILSVGVSATVRQVVNVNGAQIGMPVSVSLGVQPTSGECSIYGIVTGPNTVSIYIANASATIGVVLPSSIWSIAVFAQN